MPPTSWVATLGGSDELAEQCCSQELESIVQYSDVREAKSKQIRIQMGNVGQIAIWPFPRTPQK